MTGHLFRRRGSPRHRSFKRALAQETDLATATAVIVMNADGTLTLLAGAGLDRAALAEGLVTVAFEQETRGAAHRVSSRRAA